MQQLQVVTATKRQFSEKLPLQEPPTKAMHQGSI